MSKLEDSSNGDGSREKNGVSLGTKKRKDSLIGDVESDEENGERRPKKAKIDDIILTGERLEKIEELIKNQNKTMVEQVKQKMDNLQKKMQGMIIVLQQHPSIPSTTSYCEVFNENIKYKRFCYDSNVLPWDQIHSTICKKDLNALKKRWEKIKKNNNKPNENKDQHPIFHEAIMENLDIKDKYQLKHEDRELMQPKRADFFFISANRPNLFFAPFIVELQVGTFDNEHKGKVIKYNTMILETNLRRAFITSILTNLETMIFIKSCRNQSDNSFKHYYSDEKNFWPDKSGISGLDYIEKMLNMPKIVGYDDSLNFTILISSVKYCINEFIGQGVTAHVYSLQMLDNITLEKKEKSKYVVKKFKNLGSYNKELEKMSKVKALIEKYGSDSELFIKHVHEQKEDLAVVYTPYCEPLKQRKVTKEDAMGILRCLKELQRMGIIHRDLSYHHFMKRSDNNKIVLIDFGSATFTNPQVKLTESQMLNDSDFHTFQGSLEFAADDILKHLADPENVPYTPHRRHDIESVIKSLFYLLCGASLPIREKVQNNIDETYETNEEYQKAMEKAKKKAREQTKERAKQMLDFWTNDIYKNLNKFWRGIYDLAKNKIKDEEGEGSKKGGKTHLDVIEILEKEFEEFSGYLWSNSFKIN